MAAPARATWLVPDEHRARPQAVTVRAALRRPRHPRAIGAADQLADCGHETNHPPDGEVQHEQRLRKPAERVTGRRASQEPMTTSERPAARSRCAFAHVRAVRLLSAANVNSLLRTTE